MDIKIPTVAALAAEGKVPEILFGWVVQDHLMSVIKMLPRHLPKY